MRFTPTCSTSIPIKRPRWRLVALAALILMLTVACSAEDASDDAADTAEAANEDAGANPVGGEFGLEGRAAAGGTEVAAQDDSGDESAAATEDAAADDGEAPVQAPVDTAAPGTAATGERIIKEGTVTIEVVPGDFDAAFGQLIARAQQLGGHVAGSSSASDPASSEDGEALVSGQVTIRVPVRSFEDLLTAVGDAGRIVDRDVTSQDVTAEYTDLESRQRHLQAQERFYLGLLEQAQTVPDAIAVQQQLDGVQGQIEEITGRLNLLGDRSAFSTLTVRIREQGAQAEEIAVEGDEPGGLTPYLEDAADVLVSTVGAIILVATFLAPFAVLALLGYGVWRTVRPRATTHTDAAPPTPTAASPAREPVGAVADGPSADGPGA